MTLNLIDNKMIVRNTIELQPQRSYVSASFHCEDKESYGIEEQGIYGTIDAKINKQNKSVLTFNNSQGNTIDLKKSYILNWDKYQSNYEDKKIVNLLNEFKDQEGDTDLYNNFRNIGIIPDESDNYSFGIEKVEQEFLIDDKNFYKKSSIKNLYKYYRDNMKYHVLDPNWGFSNYNCLNFFSIYSPKNENKTHRNCLSYPNPRINNKNIYDFFNSDSLTVSFYINQNNKSKKGFHFNPGCVLFVPNMLGIYIVKGTNVDTSGLTDSFRILVVFNDNINNKSNIQSFLNTNIDSNDEVISDNSFDNVSFYLSKDNILKFNNWHNVTLLLNKSVSGSNYNIDLELFVDSEKVSEISSSTIYNKSNDSLEVQDKSFILIGNKFDNSNYNNTENLYYQMFSSVDSNGDLLGPYVKKHISFGNSLKDIHFETSNNNDTFDLLNELNPLLSLGIPRDYFEENTSFSLSAEIHDIRFYNRIVKDIKYKICENSVENFSSDNILFSVPVLYYNEDVKRESLVNLNNISNNDYINNNLSDISLSNILFRSPVNHVSSNKSYFHEVIVEKFVFEFTKKVCPNVIFNNQISSDQFNYNLLNFLSFNEDSDTNILELNNSDINKKIKSGKSINKIMSERLDSLLRNTNINQIYYENFLSYRNMFIMPCDNGLQNQNYELVKNYYEDEISFIHSNDENHFDLGHINLNKTFTEDQILNSRFLIRECSNPSLFEFTENLGRISDLESRNKYFVDTEKYFRENYDNFKNVSLNNYFRSDFNLAESDSDKFIRKINNTDQNIVSYLGIGKSNFFKDLSNPASRKLNDDFSNSIGNNLNSISYKKINTDSNNNILYYPRELPIYNLFNTKSENYSKSFCISKEMFGRKLQKETVDLFDSDLSGTFGNKKIRLKDSYNGVLYRSDCETKKAEWNYVGHCLHNEGIITVLHPSLENFSDFGYKLDFKSSSKLNVLELNLPAYSGKSNKSYNSSYINDLRLDESSFNSDEDFTYITDINLHDSNLNIIAKAKIIKPYPKKDTDNILFRLKMDY